MSRFTLPMLEEELRRTVAPTLTLSTQVRRALSLAYEAHAGQYREPLNDHQEKIPYIVHPVGVAKLAYSLLPKARLVDTSDDVLSACLTHDVLEDTKVTVSELGAVTSSRTADIVLALTKPRVAGHMSRAERSRVLLKQIGNAGATACFVKVCDGMHNLSRPQSMPAELLSKSIRKATNDYLPLTDNPSFECDIRSAYEEIIRKAELVALLTNPRVSVLTETFEDALNFCVEKAQGKILEEHDIVAAIEAVSRAVRVYIGTIDQFLRLYVGVLDERAERRARQLVLARLAKRRFELPASVFASVNLKNLGIEKIFACVLQDQDESATAKCLFVVADAQVSGWLTAENLLALVSILAERLRDRDARQLSQLAEELVHLELPLDPTLVQRARLTHYDLVTLKANIDMAAFIHHNLLAAVRNVAAEPTVTALVDRIESRVKSPHSIVKKLLTHKYHSVEQLNDFVGVRLIVGSTQTQQKLCELIVQELRSSTGALSIAISVQPESLEVEDIHSTDAYKAIHIRFKVLPSTKRLGSVSCEIQLRTVFQDAWARLSQMLLYKKLGNNPKQDSEVLSLLATLRDECDRAISAQKT